MPLARDVHRRAICDTWFQPPRFLGPSVLSLVVKRRMLEICVTANCSILNTRVEILFARVRLFLAEIFETT